MLQSNLVYKFCRVILFKGFVAYCEHLADEWPGKLRRARIEVRPHLLDLFVLRDQGLVDSLHLFNPVLRGEGEGGPKVAKQLVDGYGSSPHLLEDLLV